MTQFPDHLLLRQGTVLCTLPTGIHTNNFKYGKVRKILEERLERYAILPVLILKPKYGQPPAHQLWRCGKAAPRFRMRGPC